MLAGGPLSLNLSQFRRTIEAPELLWTFLRPRWDCITPQAQHAPSPSKDEPGSRQPGRQQEAEDNYSAYLRQRDTLEGMLCST